MTLIEELRSKKSRDNCDLLDRAALTNEEKVSVKGKYIDAEALLNNLPDDLPYKASVKRVLIQAPTADVVPKSEVEKIFEEIQKIFVHRILHNESQYFEGVLDNITKDLDELKKKYTAQNTNNSGSRQTIEENKNKYTEIEDKI